MHGFEPRRIEYVKTAVGWRFVFFCDLCGYNRFAVEAAENDRETALAKAKQTARLRFNLCRSCGRWVCDEHFNISQTACVRCAPRGKAGPPTQKTEG